MSSNDEANAFTISAHTARLMNRIPENMAVGHRMRLCIFVAPDDVEQEPQESNEFHVRIRKVDSDGAGAERLGKKSGKQTEEGGVPEKGTKVESGGKAEGGEDSKSTAEVGGPPPAPPLYVAEVLVKGEACQVSEPSSTADQAVARLYLLSMGWVGTRFMGTVRHRREKLAEEDEQDGREEKSAEAREDDGMGDV